MYRVLAQFPDQQALDTFFNEYGSYEEESPTATALPAAQRRDFFDALESVSFVTADERRGRRLQREGVPHEEPFYLDVDLWNPGSTQAEASVIQHFREFVERFGGRVVRDPLRIPSLILVKVQADARLLESLLNLDLVSLVDLPPRPLPEDSFDIFEDVQVPDVLPQIPSDGPLACVVDSGILAGHPLLRGVVLDEEDFRSGEGSSVDRNGHGTQVAGLVVYGDVARRMVNNEWFPQVRVCIAKVLKHQDDPINRTDGWAVFPEEERAEEQLREAIEYFHRERGVRIFNLSIGHPDRVYEGGRQLPWAELLDDLARRLDLVIVVSAGNVPDPVLPVAVNSVDLQRQIIENVNSPEHRLIDPATAALCLTVGSIARRADPYDNQYMTRLAGSPEGAPSPFTRTGPGVAKAVKPELVHYGGNFAIGPLGNNPTWQKTDPNLGEPSLSHNFTGGRLLKATAGTSFAAAHVTYTAARIETALREQRGLSPSANLIRALVVNSSSINKETRELLGDKQDIILQTLGYGIPSVEACWSTPQRVTLFAEDVVPHKTFHVYSLTIPPEFLEQRGRRSIRISLAYNPPTRLSRRDYISNAMWLEIYRGLTPEQIFEYRSQYQGNGEPPTVPKINKFDFKPGGQTIRMSTVQTRSWESNQGTKLDYRPAEGTDPTLQIFVGCQLRFPNPLAEEAQPYALVVTMEHQNQQIDIYQQIRNRVRTRVRVRA